MFTHQKKDYYSVNANISLDPVTEQQYLQKIMVGEQSNAQNMYQNLQDQSMQMSQTENDSASAMQTAQQQENLVNES